MSIQPDRIGMNGPIVGRRVATVIVGGVLALILAACGGGSTKSSLSGMSKDQACGNVRSLHEDSRQLQGDAAAGKVDSAGVIKKTTELATRLGALEGSLQPGPLQDAIKQWAATVQTDLSSPSAANQAATYDARDRVDDICGLPHGPR